MPTKEECFEQVGLVLREIIFAAEASESEEVSA